MRLRRESCQGAGSTTFNLVYMRRPAGLGPTGKPAHIGDGSYLGWIAGFMYTPAFYAPIRDLQRPGNEKGTKGNRSGKIGEKYRSNGYTNDRK